MYFKYHNYYSSKATISVNFSDDGRSFAISTNRVSSGINVPQLATKFDGDKFGFTGYSPLASAYISCAVSPDNHSININALS